MIYGELEFAPEVSAARFAYAVIRPPQDYTFLILLALLTFEVVGRASQIYLGRVHEPLMVSIERVGRDHAKRRNDGCGAFGEV
jgi:hypothetical protein